MTPRRIGRYLLFDAFARGGMASVHFGRVSGAVGFSRVVAIKRHHSHLAKQPEFVTMFIDEARLAGRIRHPNVVPMLDVVALADELLLVLEYVAGVSLAKLWLMAKERGERIPPPIAAAIVAGALQGLHAAHEATDDKGEPLGIVHRDVSPQNVLVAADGLARVTDFGIAQARDRLSFTKTGELKGKLEYMSKEQLRRERVDRRTDVFGASVVLWEALTGIRLFAGDTELTMLARIAAGDFPNPSRLAPEVSPELDALLGRGMSPEIGERFATALEMARELARVVGLASQIEVGEWVERVAGTELAARARLVKEVESWREGTPAATPAAPDDATLTNHEPGSEPFTEADTIARESDAPAPVPSTPRGLSRLPDPTPTPPPPQRPFKPKLTPKPKPKTNANAKERWVWLLPLAGFLIGNALLVTIAIVRSRAADEPTVEALPATVAATQAAQPEALTSPRPIASPEPEPIAPPKPDPVPVRPQRRPTAAPSSRPSAAACNPPFRVDDKGMRIPKPECFKSSTGGSVR